ncbi:hypothetical protein [Shewanella glacialipiscicola]|uniref:hypothetical protein n=1 Tax=Shewanella glacialipiscicola TaxID=614069 RepID=UPI003D7B5287
MPVKSTVKPITPELIISMYKSKILSDAHLTEDELSKLTFSMEGNRIKPDGPKSILAKLPIYK